MSSTLPLPPREQLYNRYCSNKQQKSLLRLSSAQALTHLVVAGDIMMPWESLKVDTVARGL
jgi:hypothetical protein